MTTKYEYYVPTYPYTVGWGFSDANWLAQVFTPQISHYISQVYLSLYDVSGTVVVEIWNVKQVNGDPTGYGPIVSGTGWNPCTFSSPVLLEAGTKYAIVFHMQNPGEGARVYAGCCPNYSGGGDAWYSPYPGGSPAPGAEWDRKPKIGSFDGWPYYWDGSCGFSEWGGQITTPIVTTNPATGIGVYGAILHGTLVQGGGEACDCGFEWGETIAYGNTTPTQSKTTGETFSQVIGGLIPNTTYHFRAFATNSKGTAYGADESFSSKPTVSRAYALSREEL